MRSIFNIRYPISNRCNIRYPISNRGVIEKTYGVTHQVAPFLIIGTICKRVGNRLN